MAGAFDATMKQLLGDHAIDWASWLGPLVGLPSQLTVEPIDADMSIVQPVVDKVYRLGLPEKGVLHLEPQSSWDKTFPARLLLYNALLDHRYGGPVYTIALLLRKEASSPNLDGIVSRIDKNNREYHRFLYTVVRVWELPADQLLSGGLGTTPLGLLTDDGAPRLRDLVDRFARRVEREAPSQEAADRLLACGYVLLGLRYDQAVSRAVFEGVQRMKESSTYQAILEEGRQEGLIFASQNILLALLRDKFPDVSPPVEARVRATTDWAQLQEAIRQLPRLGSPDDLAL